MDKKSSNYSEKSLKFVQKNNYRNQTKQSLRKFMNGEIDEDDFEDYMDEDEVVVYRETKK